MTQFLVDSHCHLDFPQFNEDREAVLERAEQAGVRAILSIGIGQGPAEMDAGLRMTELRPGRQVSGLQIYTTTGVHPHEARLAGESTHVRDLAVRRGGPPGDLAHGIPDPLVLPGRVYATLTRK